MPIPTERPSLKTDLKTRYEIQKAGGAYDAKTIPTDPGQRGVEGGEGFGLQDVQYTNPLFRISSLDFLQQSDFKNEGKDLSTYVKGLNTVPYISSSPR